MHGSFQLPIPGLSLRFRGVLFGGIQQFPCGRLMEECLAGLDGGGVALGGGEGFVRGAGGVAAHNRVVQGSGVEYHAG